MSTAYGQDLAFIHDAGYTFLADEAAGLLLDALRRRRITRGLVVELGCGSGALAGKVAAAGYDVLGIDLSPAMLELARRRVPRGEFRQGSALSAELPRCVAVAIVGEVLNFLFDERHSKTAVWKLLARIHAALSPGGILIFDVATPGRVPGGGPRQLFREGEGWAVLVAADEDRRRGQMTRRITSFRQVGDLYRRDEEVHRLRLFTRAEVADRLRAIGFGVHSLRGYGQRPFPPGLVGFMAAKPNGVRARRAAKARDRSRPR